ncbi:MAG: pilus assembly protein PilX [Cycloclasticus sp.]|nr:pilus assembly protein PilX [Cycloclasticus sp.]MBG95818.1 pilus assembly protein PilX [Cycloclasticus sp.]HAI96083.1 pilus assembly protein PilX [Methylococcaceae bacterium]|tara:strand:- start:426 stop:941 length:516 start_codon:yes stop_codon:yes gene_type:complete
MIINTAKQQGAALFVSLIMLLLMTLIGVTGMQSTILEEKMAGNFKDRSMSLQAGESALRFAENYLKTTVVLPSFTGTTLGHYLPTSSGAPRWDASVTNWSDTTNDVIAYNGSLTDISSPPVYIIEEMPPIPESGGSLETGVALESNYYRISVQSVGGTDTAVTLLQSIYKR